MAEEISDSQFKSEMMRHMRTLILKAGEHDKRFEMINGRLEVLQEQVRIVDGKVTDVASKVIEIDKPLGCRDEAQFG